MYIWGWYSIEYLKKMASVCFAFSHGERWNANKAGESCSGFNMVAPMYTVWDPEMITFVVITCVQIYKNFNI